MASFEYFIASSEKFFPDLSPVDLSCSGVSLATAAFRGAGREALTLRVGTTNSVVSRLRGGGTAPGFSEAAPMAGVMAIHGLCLGACGLYVKSTFGMGAAAALVASAGLTVSGNFPAYMAGVHIALLLQAGSAGVFGVQAARQLQGATMCSITEKLLPYAAMSVGSAAALGGLKQFKPKKVKAA